MKKITHEDFIKKFELISCQEYELLSEYINARTKILVKHKTCGNIFSMLPDNFINRNQRCPNCRYEKSSKSNISSAKDRVLSKISEKLGNDYEIIGEYEGYHKKIAIKHKVCDTEYLVLVSNIINGNQKCPKCSKEQGHIKRRKSPEKYKQEFEYIANGEYELLSDYIDNRTKVKVRHIKCKHIYEVLPLDFTSGTGCPKCNESKGEREIRRILDKNHVLYTSQYKISECKNKRALPFDFVIFDDNSNIVTLIEFQGIQHYKKTGYFNGIEKLKYTQKNDQIKRDFCFSENIPLIEIPYWEINNIELILEKILKIQGGKYNEFK